VNYVKEVQNRDLFFDRIRPMREELVST